MNLQSQRFEMRKSYKGRTVRIKKEYVEDDVIEQELEDLKAREELLIQGLQMQIPVLQDEFKAMRESYNKNITNFIETVNHVGDKIKQEFKGPELVDRT